MKVHKVPSTSAEATIKTLKSIFSTHGIPEQIVTGNGTGFKSGEFQDFMAQNQSSPQSCQWCFFIDNIFIR